MLKKTKFVNIICIVLVLSVLALALAVGLFGISKLRNDTPIDLLGDFTQATEPPPIANNQQNPFPYKVRSDQTVSTVHLRAQSFGDYDGKSWGSATPYTSRIDEKYPATYLSSKSIEYRAALDPAENPLVALEIIPYNSVEVVPAYTITSTAPALGSIEYAEEYNIPSDDVNANSIRNDYYRMYYYDYTDISYQPMGLDDEYLAYEKEYFEFVKEQYLNIDPEMKEYLLELSKEKYFGQYTTNLPEMVAEYVKGICEYSMDYDHTLDEQEDVVRAFIEDYKKGNCKHFATLGTLMFRALGVPARYVIGYITSTRANEWVEVSSLDAHAWVEIYVDGFGWKTVEVTPARNNELTLKPVDVSKFYDGTPLLPEQVLEGFEELEEKGYTYEVTISGEITEPGKAQSLIESIKIYNENGVNVTNNYKITLETGEMIVKIGTITLWSLDMQYDYNGILTSDLSTCRVILPEGGLWEGHSISLKKKEISTTPGIHLHTFAVVVTDENGENVTELYSYVNKFGNVEVIPRPITVIAGSASKEYDGAELTCNKLENELEINLAIGDRIESFTVEGSLTEVGRAPNVITDIVIVNENGEDVTSSYQIETVDGELTVSKKI